MTMAELERWMALDIAGRHHQRVHRGACSSGSALGRVRTQKLAAAGYRYSALRHLLSRNGYPSGEAKWLSNQPTSLLGPHPLSPVPTEREGLVRHDPRDLSREFVPSPKNAEYLAIHRSLSARRSCGSNRTRWPIGEAIRVDSSAAW